MAFRLGGSHPSAILRHLYCTGKTGHSPSVDREWSSPLCFPMPTKTHIAHLQGMSQPEAVRAGSVSDGCVHPSLTLPAPKAMQLCRTDWKSVLREKLGGVLSCRSP